MRPRTASRPARRGAPRTGAWSVTASFAPREVLHQCLELGRVHLRAEGLGHHTGEVLEAFRDRGPGVEDLAANRRRVAPRAHVGEIGRDLAAPAVELVATQAPAGFDERLRLGAPAGEG